MIECGLNKCICVKNTTVDGIETGKIYQYTHEPEYELRKENKTYCIIYGDEEKMLPCNYDYFQEHFIEA